MCGRFTLRTPSRQVAQLFDLPELPLFEPRYNIAPRQQVLAVRMNDDGAREAAMLEWGFVPSWSKDPRTERRPINIRSETAAERPMFRAALRSRRCLIAADGFYEWLAEGRSKLPYYFQLADGQPFALAGVWEAWRRQEERLETCALFTTSANEVVAPLHDRMPVILRPPQFAAWLDPTNEDPRTLAPLWAPLPADQLSARAVSQYVNNARHEGPECTMVVPSQGKLFD